MFREIKRREIKRREVERYFDTEKEVYGYQQIKPQTDITIDQARAFVNSLFEIEK